MGNQTGSCPSTARPFEFYWAIFFFLFTLTFFWMSCDLSCFLYVWLQQSCSCKLHHFQIILKLPSLWKMTLIHKSAGMLEKEDLGHSVAILVRERIFFLASFLEKYLFTCPIFYCEILILWSQTPVGSKKTSWDLQKTAYLELGSVDGMNARLADVYKGFCDNAKGWTVHIRTHLLKRRASKKWWMTFLISREFIDRVDT